MGCALESEATGLVGGWDVGSKQHHLLFGPVLSYCAWDLGFGGVWYSCPLREELYPSCT